jgi:S-adenosylmethionine decarboxylase
MKRIIGSNFVIDIYNVNERFLKEKALLNLLKKLIKILKSKPVGKPVIKKISSPEYLFSGYSVFQIIKESHIAFHTWPEYNYLAIDIFSCKKIQVEKVVNFFKRNLNKEIEIRIEEYKRVARV